MADNYLGGYIMAAWLYFRGSHISYPWGKRMARHSIIFLVYSYPLALGRDSLALLSQSQNVIENSAFRLRKNKIPMKTKVESWIQKIKSWVVLLLIVLKLFVYGREEKNTEDPASAYLYWSGDQTVPNDLKLVHGKY